MSDIEKTVTSQDVVNFKIDRVKTLSEIYSDDASAKRRHDQTARYSSGTYRTAAEVRDALNKALTNKDTIVETSKQLYATNPIYASCVVLRIGEDILLSDGTSGYVDPQQKSEHTFNEARDYFYPIPIDERSLNPNLTQNPGWNDGLDF